MGENIKPRDHKFFSGWKKVGLKILAGLVVVAVLVSGGVYSYRKVTYESICNGDVDNPLYKQAAQAIVDVDLAALKPIDEKISKVKDHEKDANCMYARIMYSLYTYDLKNLEAQFKKFEAAYKPEKGLAPVYILSAKTIDDVRPRVEATIRQSKSIENSKVFY